MVSYIIPGEPRRLYADVQLKKWEEENHKGCEIDGRHYATYETTQLMRKLEAAGIRTQFEKSKAEEYSSKYAKETARAKAQVNPEAEYLI